MPTTQRNPTNLATNHDKHVIHLILLNDGFMWLVESHDLFRSADAIRWFIYDLRKAYLDEHGCDFRVFFCGITMSTVTRMDGISTYKALRGLIRPLKAF